MNPITLLKLAGLAEAAKTVGKATGKVFQAAGSVGGAIGKNLGSEAIGKTVGYAAPVLVANHAANQYAPTRRGKAWLGQQMGAAGNAVGSALIPRDFGSRPGDFGSGGGGYY